MNAERIHPLKETIDNAEEILLSLQNQAMDVQARIKNEADAALRAREAEDILKRGEDEVKLEAMMAGKAKQGPLGGVATSSKAYTAILEGLVTEARSSTLKREYDAFCEARGRVEGCRTSLEMSRIYYSALRNMAALKSSILNALSA